MRTLHLFAGAGGGLLADLILGHEPIAAVEWDAYCCQVLRERADEGWFPGLRVHEGDVRLFDPSDYAGRVDCIHAGFPCQDISHAGKQAGVGEDTRSGLYREVLRVADIVRPRYLFLENVAAILSNGLGTVLGDLAARGYDCRWTCIRAAEVGAPHLRDRWWCLAVADAGHYARSLGSGGGEGGRAWGNEFEGGGACSDVAGADLARLQGRVGSILHECAGEWATGEGGALADTWGRRSEVALQQRGGSAEAIGERETSWTGMRSASCDAGWWRTEPDVGRVAHGVASRVDRLKALGNGQVPLQAALAWRILTA